MITWIICTAFARHIDRLHNADYEVCSNPLCRFAYWLELMFRREWSE